MIETKKSKFQDELEQLSQIISGEVGLRKREEVLDKVKKEAVENQNNIRRRNIVSGKTKLEKDPILEDEKPVVQNIKLFEWEAPDRYEFKLSHKPFLIIVILSLFFILLLAILRNYFLMGSVIALLFVVYVFGTTKPQIVKHKITARGLDTGGRLYEWFLLKNFYFTKKNGQLMLLIETSLRLPAMLMFLVNEKDMKAIFVLLQEKLLYKDIRKQGRLEKINYGEYIPLEKI